MKLNVSTVKQYLEGFYKYKANHDDDFIIEFAIEDRIEYVKHYCNISTVPECLNSKIIKMVVGEFLYQKYLLGGAEALGVETIALVSSITEDDTSFSFNSNNEQSGDALLLDHINSLRFLTKERVFLIRHRSTTPK